MPLQSSDGPVRTASGTLYSGGDADVHPVAAVHRGRGRTGRKHRSRVSLHDRDVDTVLRPGWLPQEGDLPPESDNVKFIGLDELRAEQKRHLEQVRGARQVMVALKVKFEEEDAAHQVALKKSFDEGNEAPPDKRTPNGKRDSAISRAQETVAAADAASISWAEGALDRARSLAPDWSAAVAASNGRLNTEIEKLQAQIEELRQEQRADLRLVAWIRRINVPTHGSHIAFSDAAPGALPSDIPRHVFPGAVSMAPPGLPPEDEDQSGGVEE